MTFVDTNVIMYAVGGEHPLRSDARAFFESCLETGEPLCTSAEVLQELLHAYLGARRLETLDSAMTLTRARITTIWPTEREDVELARTMIDRFPSLGARDLLHLASCRRRNVDSVQTYDRALRSAFP